MAVQLHGEGLGWHRGVEALKKHLQDTCEYMGTFSSLRVEDVPSLSMPLSKAAVISGLVCEMCTSGE